MLVYWEQLGVLIALNPLRDQSTRRTARLRVRANLLTGAYERGIAFEGGYDECSAVALLPGLLGHYIPNQQSLHDLTRSEDAAEEINSLLWEPEPTSDDTIRAVAQRWGMTASGTLLAVRSWRFRERVLSAYAHRCAVCGARHGRLATLKLIPWTSPGSSDDTSNGLALCADHYQAYDKALITVNPEYQVLFSEAKARFLARDHLHSGIDQFIAGLRPIIVLPAEKRLRPRRDLLELGSAIRGWAG
jgi:putative restriction endonuclease